MQIFRFGKNTILKLPQVILIIVWRSVKRTQWSRYPVRMFAVAFAGLQAPGKLYE